MAIDKKQLMRDCAEEVKASDMDAGEKLEALGPLMALCDRNLSESDFRLWLEIYEISMVDPVVERKVKEFINLMHYSGMITIGERMSDTWLDIDSATALQGVTDEELAKFISEVEIDIMGMEAYIG